MKRLKSLLCVCVFLVAGAQGGFAANEHLLEPKLIVRGENTGVALTFDACSGGIDYRVLDTLIEENIPATLFVTARWLRDNDEAFARMRARPDLFQIEDHGAEHIPPVLGTEKVYGISPAGTEQKILDEVIRGSAAIEAAGVPRPSWYRGATALYSPAIIPVIRSLGYEIAGYSLNADYGASASADIARKNISAAKDGDVVLAHINQPNRSAGEGIAQGLRILKENGAKFVLLRDVETSNDID